MEGEGAALDAGGRVRSGVTAGRVVVNDFIRLALLSVIFGPTHAMVTGMGVSKRTGALVGAVVAG